MWFQEHEKTKKEVVNALKAEVTELKKELQQRKKMIAMQQQIIQHGSETYNKVRSAQQQRFTQMCL